MPGTFLYCADPLNPRRTDPHFAAEAAAVRDLGGTVHLVDHDALLSGDPGAAIRRVPAGTGPFWYRGWMVPSARYAGLDAALGGRLVVTPAGYQAAHELPGWYETFADVTPASVWLPAPVTAGEAGALALRLPPGPGLVKDYVKSRKHEWAAACFIPDLRDGGAVRGTAARFLELQAGDLAGGLVLRVFEDLRGERGRAAEARVWWVDGEPVLVGPHPDTPAGHPVPELAAIGDCVQVFGRRFVTTDVAQHSDGRWRVIEVGDGQVSDLPAGTDCSPVLKALVGAPPGGWERT
ncbi:ATP-grasp domain-containing protein [Longispora albida]|uniref:ATP-grasp domain-containing protein n=1 Tax=Longispora albida TaxID=203523 RepID=UPI0003602A34|nr:ATP-grasp domain-containing protein [Longispora albida]